MDVGLRIYFREEEATTGWILALVSPYKGKSVVIVKRKTIPDKLKDPEF